MPAGAHKVSVRKTLNGMEWVAAGDLEFAPRQITRLELSLAPSVTLLQITTVPQEAEIYLDRQPTVRNSANDVSPALFQEVKEGPHSIAIRKAGFRDTSLQVDIGKSRLSQLQITLTEEKDFFALQEQQDFYKVRSDKHFGIKLGYTSVGMLLVSGSLLGLAAHDLQVARSANNRLQNSTLDQTAIANDFALRNDRVARAHSLEKGSVIAISASLLCAVVGVVYYF